MDIVKIKNIIYNWRQQFISRDNTTHITSRQANRKFINLLKGGRDINRFKRIRKRRRRREYCPSFDTDFIPTAESYLQPKPSAPSYVGPVPSAPVPSAPVPSAPVPSAPCLEDDYGVVKVDEIMNAEVAMPH